MRNEKECVCSVCLFCCNIFIGVQIIKEIAIRLPTDATVYFVYLFPFLPYMFRALISPSSGVSQAVFFIYNHLVRVVFMLLICVCLWTSTVKPP